MRVGADYLPQCAINRGWWFAAAVFRRTTDGLRALFHGDADCTGAPSPHPNDQLYHYYLGDPLEVLLLRSDGTTDRVVVGPNLRGGEHLQLFILGDTFHTARVMGRRRWFLGASTEWPGVVPADVETGNVEELAAKYPSIAADLRAIAASVRHDRGSA